ncbi:putative bifunctional diguanylate cyclase/phosphodiesterase [Rhizobium halophilum]|uniref:putative bifunctional diguanylate cyclase/phosphodiesterase n=1 Tax=Rhizobium halophilum TaxID=2846852 RepID=UPI001EFCC6DA|nr:EAL domain-containing protein [Rhizobium halophilum]MCF6367604.1 EAL domain-containing protein [Rhizobium halophilum]
MLIPSVIRQFFLPRYDSTEFRRAQYFELSRQIPLMYAIVIVNMIMLALTYVDKAPAVLSIWTPAFFVTVCLVRAIRMVIGRAQAPSDAVIEKALRTVVVLACTMGIAVSVWSLLLFSYGDTYTKVQNTFFTGITIIAVMTCLRPLRQVAPILFLLVVLPTAAFLALQDHTVFHAIAINMVLAIGGMIVVMQRSHSDFRQRIEKEVELDRQRKQLQSLNAEVSLLANQDSLTGLANRRCFFDHLERRIADHHAGRARQPFAVGVLDLDGFKPVNDIFGHGVGDQLLREVGERLTANLPEGTLLARLGGDEFALILWEIGKEDDLKAICTHALEALEPPFVFQEGSVTISATCGIACFPGVATSGEELFEKADFALYYSKEYEKGAVAIFSDLHEAEIKKTAAVAQRLRAVDEDAFHLAYQPIVDRNGYALGFEALARWHDPVLGDVRPDVFIRVAEQAGIIGKVTVPLFRSALRAARTWPDNLRLSFNLSAFDVCSQSTMEAILREIEVGGIPPTRLMFEITESAIMQDFSRAVEALARLRAKGAAVALDDFGTGYSSLSYLRRLPIDRIKVDQSFIQDLEKEASARDMMRTISAMCQSLGLQCIVEGVETHAQLQFLSAAGCDGYQGYLFARPMPLTAISRYLADQERLRERA